MAVPQIIQRLSAAIAADDLDAFAPAFTALADQIGIEHAKFVAEALIQERARAAAGRPFAAAQWPVVDRPPEVAAA